MIRSSTILATLVAGVILVLVVAVVVPALNSHRTSSQSETVTQTGLQFQIQELNQTNTIKAGTTATFIFNVTSPVTGTLYFGVSTAPSPHTYQSITLDNMTSQNFQLPHGIKASYPNGNAMVGTSHGIASFRLTLSSTVPTGNLTLDFTVLQSVSSSQVSSEGHGFTLAVQTYSKSASHTHPSLRTTTTRIGYYCNPSVLL